MEDGSKIVAKGLGASPGTGRGKLAFNPEDAVRRAKAGEAVVFLCDEGSAEDRPGIEASNAVVSVRGGLTGDAAIMARALGKPCVIGVAGARVYYTDKRLVIRQPGAPELTLGESDEVSVNGKTGELALVAMPK